MLRFKMTMAMAFFGSALFVSSHASAAVITLHSGNGTIGGTDSAISMLVGPADSAFGSMFSVADFAAARSGPNAFIISRHPFWLSTSLFSDPTANYISTNASGASEGASALFAIDFIVPDTIIASATIDFNFVVDNFLGDTGGGPNQGLFLNGIALSGSTSGGGLGFETNHTRNDIGGLLVSGLNTLYINGTDVGGPGGLLFSTTITTVAGKPAPNPTSSVPEPVSLSLLAFGLFGLGAIKRRRRMTA